MIHQIARLLTVFPDQLAEKEARAWLRAAESAVGDVFGWADRRRVAHVVATTCRRAPEVADDGGDWARWRRVTEATMALQRRALAEVGAALAQRQVGLALPKGRGFQALRYPGVPVLSADVDLLVQSHAVPEVKEVLRSLGYSQELVVLDGRAIRISASRVRELESTPWLHGQLAPFSRWVALDDLAGDAEFVTNRLGRGLVSGGRVYIRLVLDVHYSLNVLTDVVVDDDRPREDVWWADVVPVCIGEDRYHILGDVTLSWFLPLHFYHDVLGFNEQSLKGMVDIVHMTTHDLVPWHELLEICRRYQAIAPAVSHVHRLLADLCGHRLPPAHAEIMSEGRAGNYADLGSLDLARFVALS